MNYLAKRHAVQEFNAGNKRNMHNGVIYNVNGPDITAIYSGFPEVCYTYKTIDPKRQRFTIEMIERGYVYLVLLPFLNIVSQQGETGIIFEYHRKPTGTGYDYSEQTGLLTQEFEYNYYTVTVCQSVLLKPGDKVIIYINWDSGERTFGFTSNNPNLEYPVEEINSALSCTGKFKIYGNLGSLLHNSDDCGYMFDLRGFVVGNETFKRFFASINTNDLTMNGDGSNTLSASYENYLYNKLVDASELYLPKYYNVESAYEQLFYNNTLLKKGPKYIFVAPKEKYCAQMFEGCTRFNNYSVFLDSTNHIASEDSEGNMYRMFANTAGLGTVCWNDGEYECAYKNSSKEMLYKSLPLKFVWDGEDPQDDINSLFENLSSTVLPTNTEPGWYNRVDYQFLHPIIWIDDVEATMQVYGWTTFTEYNSDSYYGKMHGRPFKFIGTIFVENDCRSYYVWEATGHLTGICDTHCPNVQYIFTTEKNFIDESTYETNKAQCRPIKYCVSSIDFNECTWTEYSYDCSKLVVVQSSHIIPEQNAGIPQISIEKKYSSFSDIYNYNHYRSSEYRLVGKLNGDWLWRLYRDSITTEYDRDYINDEDIVGNIPLYLTTNTLLIFHTLVNDNTTTNYYGISQLFSDRTVYNGPTSNLCIIDFNVSVIFDTMM